jgi:putative chitinase
MPKLSPTWAERFLPYLEAAMREFGITTKQRRCAFLTQLAVESNELTRWREDLNYKAQRLMVVFPTKFKTITEADEYAHNPERIANRVYANRMENGPEASGDGWRFRGRGPIQLTGRANYRIFGGELGLPLEDEPDLAAQYEHGFRIAGLYWRRGGCNSLADKLTMRGDNYDRQCLIDITRCINGGRNSLAERINYFRIAKQVLHSDEQPAAATTAAAPAPSPAPALPAKPAPAEPDVDLLDAAVTSTKTRALLWPRIVKHGTAASVLLGALYEHHQLATVAIGGVAIAALAWVVYHNRARVKALLLKLMN